MALIKCPECKTDQLKLSQYVVIGRSATDSLSKSGIKTEAETKFVIRPDQPPGRSGRMDLLAQFLLQRLITLDGCQKAWSCRPSHLCPFPDASELKERAKTLSRRMGAAVDGSVGW